MNIPDGYDPVWEAALKKARRIIQEAQPEKPYETYDELDLLCDCMPEWDIGYILLMLEQLGVDGYV